MSSQLPLLDACDICGSENVVTIEVDEEFVCPECQIDELTTGLSVRVRSIISDVDGFMNRHKGSALHLLHHYGNPDTPEGWQLFMEREWFWAR